MNRSPSLDRPAGYDPAMFRLDRLLRFEPSVHRRYERERGCERARSLQVIICIGLIFYNAYNLTSLFLLSDILWLSVGLRLFLVTPASLAVAWTVVRVGPAMREALVTGGIVNAFAVPVFLFWLTEAPLGAYTFGELTLTLVFGTMLLALRFRHALIFTGVAFTLAATAAVTKAGLDPSLRAAFLLQMATGCCFCLYANFRLEWVRGRAYLEELGATLTSEEAVAARDRFLDLSMTDPLTGLPNRRGLDRTVESWTGEGGALTVMMVDIDHFKLFNDALGHPEGDRCLRAVAAALSETAGAAGAFAARFGGEEFAILARGGDALQAARLANGLLDAVRAQRIAHPARRDGCATAGNPPNALFEAADAALYAAKAGRRNRYVLADPNGPSELRASA